MARRRMRVIGKREEAVFYALLLLVLTAEQYPLALVAFMAWTGRSGIAEVAAALRKTG